MKFMKRFMLFFLVVLLILFSFESVLADICLKDLGAPKYIERPNPIIVVEFGDPVNLNTLNTVFNYYPAAEGGRNFEEPDDRTDYLNLMVESSNASILRYNLTEELVDGDFYTVYVSAEMSQVIGGNEDSEGEIATVLLEECTLFRVDLGPFDVDLKYPLSEYISDSEKLIEFETNRRATCYISSNTDSIRLMTMMSSTGESYIHRHIHPGESPFFVSCETTESEISKEFDLVLDTIPPNPPIIDDSSSDQEYPGIYTSTAGFRVRFDADDPVSGIRLINFTIVDAESGVEAIEWTTTDRIGETLQLTRDGLSQRIELNDRRDYYFVAKALNNAGLWSEKSESTGFRVDVNYDPNIPEDSCEELGINCENGEACENNQNCLSGFCHPEEFICVEPSCDDGFKNADETDVDCGGSNCPVCDLGKMCLDHSDCISEFCDRLENICAEPPEEEPEIVFPDPEPVEEESQNNILMPIIFTVLIIGLIGGGGYYGYLNKDIISSKLSSLSQPSQSKPVQPTPSQRTVQKPITSAPNNHQSNEKPKPTTTQIKDMGAKVSHRLKEKEKQRQRDNLFGNFSSASSSSNDADKSKDDKDVVTKKDIDNLFGGIN